MLVVLSDLHFTDGTAGDHNLPPETLSRVILSDWMTLAARCRAVELRVVLLGDILDLVRTERWFDLPPEHRPWGREGLAVLAGGGADSPLARCALDILGRMPPDGRPESAPPATILAKNWAAFALLRELPARAAEALGRAIPVTVEFVPGNHDRLTHAFPALRAAVREMLGLAADGAGALAAPFSPECRAPAYGLLARHGHVFDPWNAGGPGAVPAVGDVITTEFAVKLPWAMGRHPAVSAEWLRGLRAIDNVRPLGRIMEWLDSRIRAEALPEIRTALEEAFESVAAGLLEIDFLRTWRDDKTDWDEAVRWLSSPWIRWLPRKALEILRAQDLLPLFLKASEDNPDPSGDALIEGLLDERAWVDDPEIRYLALGHTHNPLVLPLECRAGRDVVYINAGTWRERLVRAAGSGAPAFVPLKHTSYAVFYQPGEGDADAPRFDFRSAIHPA